MTQETDNLLTLGRLYGEAKGYSLTTVATYLANGGAFFSKLEQGKSVTVRKYHDLLDTFSREWPDDLAWPEDIPRPAKDQGSGASVIQEQERM